EHERGVGRDDSAGAPGPISKCGRDDESALSADLHRRNAFVPPAYDPAFADRKFERLAAVDRAVEFLALDPVHIKPARVMHDAGLPGFRRGAGADFDILDLQSRCG